MLNISLKNTSLTNSILQIIYEEVEGRTVNIGFSFDELEPRSGLSDKKEASFVRNILIQQGYLREKTLINYTLTIEGVRAARKLRPEDERLFEQYRKSICRKIQSTLQECESNFLYIAFSFFDFAKEEGIPEFYQHQIYEDLIEQGALRSHTLNNVVRLTEVGIQIISKLAT